MKHRFVPLLLSVLAAALVQTVSAQDHGHLNVGSVGTNQNDQLTFDNGAVFATNAGYIKTLTYTNGFQYAGYYQGNITMTGLAATEAHLGPVDHAPALGSRLFAQLLAVEGPGGGAFAFWDTGATVPTISVACGSTGTNTFLLSENDGSPGTDPYGHIHGRRFTATLPGIYAVTFRAFDFSTNGADGGPIHTPSAPVTIYFQAGDNLQSVRVNGPDARIRFAARAGYSWQLEGTTTLNPPAWQPVGDAVTGDDYLHEVLETNLTASNRLYRVEGTPINP